MKLLQASEWSRVKKRILAAALAAFIGFADFQAVSASKIDEAEERRDEAQQGLDEINREIDGIREEQGRLLAEMEDYDAELMSLLTTIELLNNDIAAKKLEIEHTTTDLSAAEQEERQQYEGMKLRIQYMYENGDASIWTALVEADSIADFLNRVEYVSEVYDYDRRQLESYQATVQRIADLKDRLSNDLAAMEELEINYEEQKGDLELIIAEKSRLVDNYEVQLAAANELAENYAATILQQNNIIADEKRRQDAARAAANNNGGGNGGGNSGGNGGNGLTTTGLNPPYVTGVSGNDVVAYASQFVGNPYVYGGNSLTEGCDCSYFVMACFGYFGITLPRTSYEIEKCGQTVSYDCAMPGDIICYAGHVAIYTGNGGIVHASSPTNGICYGTATYRTMITIRRVL